MISTQFQEDIDDCKLSLLKFYVADLAHFFHINIGNTLFFILHISPQVYKFHLVLDVLSSAFCEIIIALIITRASISK